MLCERAIGVLDLQIRAAEDAINLQTQATHNYSWLIPQPRAPRYVLSESDRAQILHEVSQCSSLRAIGDMLDDFSVTAPSPHNTAELHQLVDHMIRSLAHIREANSPHLTSSPSRNTWLSRDNNSSTSLRSSFQAFKTFAMRPLSARTSQATKRSRPTSELTSVVEHKRDAVQPFEAHTPRLPGSTESVQSLVVHKRVMAVRTRQSVHPAQPALLEYTLPGEVAQ